MHESLVGGNILEDKLSDSFDFSAYYDKISYLATYLSEHQSLDFDRSFNLGNAGCIDLSRFKNIIDSFELDCDNPSSQNKINNIIYAGIIFFVLTEGKYPDEIWPESLLKKSECYFDSFTESINKLKRDIIDHYGDRGLITDFSFEELDKVFNSVLSYDERNAIYPFVKKYDGVGVAKLFEMLWEVFVKKYSLYSVNIWCDKLNEFKKKKHCEYCSKKEKNKYGEFFAASYGGKLDKPMHSSCEDYSEVKMFYKNNTIDGWLIVSADGVGSSLHSYLGSKIAVQSLINVISNFYKKVVEKPSMLSLFDNTFSQTLYQEWERNILLEMDARRIEKDEHKGLNDFCSTLQFAFGCDCCIVCGAVGDGTFYIRKKIDSYEGQVDAGGGFLLNDGFSGVTSSSVFNMTNLKNHPEALQLFFFDPRYITDIFISSDGVTPALVNSFSNIHYEIKRIGDMPFDERCDYLKSLTKQCADYNLSNFGSGDDSSIAYVHFNKYNKE